MTGTGPTFVPEQATSCAKTTKNKLLDKWPEVCRSPAPVDNSPCKYQEPLPLRILWSNPEIRGNRTSTQQKHVLKKVQGLFERTAKTLEILQLYKEELCLLPSRIYVSAMNDIGEAALRSRESCQFLAQMVFDKMSKTLNVSFAPQLTSGSFRLWSKAQLTNVLLQWNLYCDPDEFPHNTLKAEEKFSSILSPLHVHQRDSYPLGTVLTAAPNFGTVDVLSKLLTS